MDANFGRQFWTPALFNLQSLLWKYVEFILLYKLLYKLHNKPGPLYRPHAFIPLLEEKYL